MSLVIGALAIVLLGLWLLGFRYAALRQRAVGADGTAYDILVHRDGVVLVNGSDLFVAGFLAFPTLVDLVRRVRRGPWHWAVTVRCAPFPGHIDLLHEVFPGQDSAQSRADELDILIRDGERLWPIEAEH